MKIKDKERDNLFLSTSNPVGCVFPEQGKLNKEDMVLSACL